MTIKQLYQLIQSKKTMASSESYTSSLFSQGKDRIIQKCGEEAIEVIIAAKNQSRTRLIEEISDLTYHLLVLMVEAKITINEISNELNNRNSFKTNQERMIK